MKVSIITSLISICLDVVVFTSTVFQVHFSAIFLRVFRLEVCLCVVLVPCACNTIMDTPINFSNDSIDEVIGQMDFSESACRPPSPAATWPDDSFDSFVRNMSGSIVDQHVSMESWGDDSFDSFVRTWTPNDSQNETAKRSRVEQSGQDAPILACEAVLHEEPCYNPRFRATQFRTVYRVKHNLDANTNFVDVADEVNELFEKLIKDKLDAADADDRVS